MPTPSPESPRPVPARGALREATAVESGPSAGAVSTVRRRAADGAGCVAGRGRGCRCRAPTGAGRAADAPRSEAGVPAAQVRDALAHLYDPGHLQTHPLAVLAAPSPAAPSAGRALRQALFDAVDALRPERGGVPNARAARRHGILRLRYVEGRPVDDDPGSRWRSAGASTTASTGRRSRRSPRCCASASGDAAPATGGPPPATDRAGRGDDRDAAAST